METGGQEMERALAGDVANSGVDEVCHKEQIVGTASSLGTDTVSLLWPPLGLWLGKMILKCQYLIIIDSTILSIL